MVPASSTYYVGGSGSPGWQQLQAFPLFATGTYTGAGATTSWATQAYVDSLTARVTAAESLTGTTTLTSTVSGQAAFLTTVQNSLGLTTTGGISTGGAFAKVSQTGTTLGGQMSSTIFTSVRNAYVLVNTWPAVTITITGTYLVLAQVRVAEIDGNLDAW
jgi:hypothetical protein